MSGASHAQKNDAHSFHLFDSDDLTVDMKFIDPEKGYFGIDYRFGLTKKIGTLGSDSVKNIEFELSSIGFVTVKGDDNQHNSLINEFRFKGFPLFRVKPKEAESGNSYEDFMDDELSDSELIDASRNMARRVSSPLWLFANVHGKHETSQDFKKYDFAFGSQVSISSSYLTSILDFPFGIIRSEANNNPRQLDLSIGYDYVTGIENTDLAPLKEGENHMNRLNLKAEWETGIFSGKDRIVFLIDSYYDLNATEIQKAEKKEWNHFYMIKLERLINETNTTRTKIAVKYTQGALPPNYNEGYVLGGGFSIEF